MPSRAEIAYREAVRALEYQTSSLDALRSRAMLVTSAGLAAAALYGRSGGSHGAWFVAALVAAGGASLTALWLQARFEVWATFDSSALVETYVDDPSYDDDMTMRDLAIHAHADWVRNEGGVRRRQNALNVVLTLVSVEVVFLLTDTRW
jgi:hypothetical protein